MKKAIHTVTKALQEGAIFVLIILIVLLADVRSAIIVTLVLPLAALFAFIMMKWYGLSANLMSLGGLAIGIGMMVDGAVVMVENVHRHLTEKPGRKQSARRTPTKSRRCSTPRRKSGRPIVFGIFIIIIVFLPLFTLEGFEGKMFAPLAFTISFALLGSLILSLTLVPMLCTFFLKQEPHEHDPFHIRWLKAAYLASAEAVRAPSRGSSCCSRVARARRLVRARAAASARSFCRRSTKAPSRCRPSASRASRCRNRSICKREAEKILKQFPEVIDVVSKTGRADIASDPMGVELSDVIVTLKPREEWTTTKSKEELVEKMREALARTARRRLQLLAAHRAARR